MPSRALALIASCLLMLVAACYEKRDHRPPTDPDDAFLQLAIEGSQASLPADGVSQLTLVASITGEAAAGRRAITLKTTSGTWVGAATATPLTIQVEADQSGQAHAELRSSQEVGTAVVTAEVSLGTTDKLVARMEIPFTSPDPGALVRFLSAPATAPADGASRSRFVVELAESIPIAERTVSFATTAGSFSVGTAMTTTTVAAGPNRTVAIDLFSPPSLGTGVVSATVKNFRADTAIQFTRAPAETIAVTLDRVSVENSLDGVIQITATLSRTAGTPTAKTPVTIRVTDATGAHTGRFRETGLLSDSSGNVTTHYSPAGEAALGPATVRVSADGSPATGRATFEIVSPD